MPVKKGDTVEDSTPWAEVEGSEFLKPPSVLPVNVKARLLSILSKGGVGDSDSGQVSFEVVADILDFISQNCVKDRAGFDEWSCKPESLEPAWLLAARFADEALKARGSVRS